MPGPSGRPEPARRSDSSRQYTASVDFNFGSFVVSLIVGGVAAIPAEAAAMAADVARAPA